MNISNLARYSLSMCAAIATIAGCGDETFSQGRLFTFARETALRGHIYVGARGPGPTYSQTAYRYSLLRGKPRHRPDLTYASSAPLTVDSSNNFYATFAGGTESTISVYPPNSNNAARTIKLSCDGSSGNCFQVGVDGIVVDSEGYQYVGLHIYTQDPYSKVRHYTWKVDIFAPGTDSLVNTIILGYRSSSPGSIGGLALDRSGDILVAQNIRPTSEIFTYATPVTNPTRIRTLKGPGIVNPLGLAIDVNDELYVDNLLGSRSFIAAYPVSAHGTRKPDREIMVSGAEELGEGLAVSAGRVFVPDPLKGAVFEIRSGVGGKQNPISTLSLTGAIAAALGS